MYPHLSFVCFHSWVSPIDNCGRFTLSINARRHTLHMIRSHPMPHTPTRRIPDTPNTPPPIPPPPISTLTLTPLPEHPPAPP